MSNKKIKLEYVSVDDLREADYNPNTMTDEDRKQLRKSLSDFGCVEPLVVNFHPGREGIIVGGKHRKDELRELGYKQVPCVKVDLDESREKELNVRLNRNRGRWDWNKLADEFKVDELKAWGFEDRELKDIVDVEFNKKVKANNDDTCAYPIVQRFGEKYRSMIIVCESDADIAFVRSALGMDKNKSYKSDQVGETYVTSGKEFIKRWKSK